MVRKLVIAAAGNRKQKAIPEGNLILFPKYPIISYLCTLISIL